MEVGKLKELLGISKEDETQDASLQFVLEDVQETIRNYCNLDALPAGLENTAYRMAMDLYRYERPGDSDAPIAVASISEGDTATSFSGTTEVMAALSGGFLKNYQEQLNRYRKLVW